MLFFSIECLPHSHYTAANHRLSLEQRNAHATCASTVPTRVDEHSHLHDTRCQQQNNQAAKPCGSTYSRRSHRSSMCEYDYMRNWGNCRRWWCVAFPWCRWHSVMVDCASRVVECRAPDTRASSHSIWIFHTTTPLTRIACDLKMFILSCEKIQATHIFPHSKYTNLIHDDVALSLKKQQQQTGWFCATSAPLGTLSLNLVVG